MTPKILALLSVTIGIFPLLVMLLGLGLARILGCQVDEGRPHKCLFCGRDIGRFLYGTYVFAWLGLVTGPIGILGVIASVVWWYFS